MFSELFKEFTKRRANGRKKVVFTLDDVSNELKYNNKRIYKPLFFPRNCITVCELMKSIFYTELKSLF